MRPCAPSRRMVAKNAAIGRKQVASETGLGRRQERAPVAWRSCHRLDGAVVLRHRGPVVVAEDGRRGLVLAHLVEPTLATAWMRPMDPRWLSASPTFRRALPASCGAAALPLCRTPSGPSRVARTDSARVVTTGPMVILRVGRRGSGC